MVGFCHVGNLLGNHADDGDDDDDPDHNDTLDLLRATAYRWRLLTFTVPLSMFQKVSQD